MGVKNNVKSSDTKLKAPELLLTLRENALRDLDLAADLLTRTVRDEDFALIPRSVHCVMGTRRFLTGPFMRIVCERFAPEILPQLETLILTLPRGAADDREDEELCQDSAAMSDSEDISHTAPKDPKQPLPQRVRVMDDRTLTRLPADAYPLIVRTMVRLLLALLAYDRTQVTAARELVDALLSDLHASRPDGGRALAHQHGHDALIGAAAQLQMRVYEKLQADSEADLLSGLRDRQRAMLTAATRAGNTHAQAVLTVAIAQSLVCQRRFTQAAELLEHVAFPSAAKVDSAVHARFLFLRGLLASLQLRYSQAAAFLEHALRKCPPHAHGFRQAVLKALVCAQLSLGTVPARALFNHPDTRARAGLQPYLELARCVRAGDVLGFQAILDSERHCAAYRADGLLALVQRLRESVLRSGLRRLSLSYSRISVAEVAAALHIERVEDAELMLVKAIHDGVITADLQVDAQVVTTPIGRARYASGRPRRALLQRAAACLETQEQATEALRFPSVSSVE